MASADFVRAVSAGTVFWIKASTREVFAPDGEPVRNIQMPSPTGDLTTALVNLFGTKPDVEEPECAVGSYYKRLYRPDQPPLSDDMREARDTAVHAARAI